MESVQLRKTLSAIATAFGQAMIDERDASAAMAARDLSRGAGATRPAPRQPGDQRLSMSDQEEISRGLAAGLSGAGERREARSFRIDGNATLTRGRVRFAGVSAATRGRAGGLSGGADRVAV